MTLAHLPGTEEHHHGNSYSIKLGFRVVQDLGKFIMVLNQVLSWYLYNYIFHFYFFFISVIEYNLGNELHNLLRYYERFWIDTVTPARFTVCRLQHRTNNYIESYHASLLRLMGQHPPLYRFYGNYFVKSKFYEIERLYKIFSILFLDHLRTIEERARNDFGRAVNRQRVWH